LGDINPKLKSISAPSSPATDVSFELPSENIVLKGRVSSLSLGGNNGNFYYTQLMIMMMILLKIM